MTIVDTQDVPSKITQRFVPTESTMIAHPSDARWRKMASKFNLRPARKRQRHCNLRLEGLEPRLMLSTDWRNPVNWLDVNADTEVTPGDALLIMKELNENGPGPLPPRTDHPTEPFYDVTGDNHIAPGDALEVMNAINDGYLGKLTLAEGDSFVTEFPMIIGVGQEAGSRRYRFELEAVFDTAAVEDVFAVYLVDVSFRDSQNGSKTTLLDRGVPGTSLFSLVGNDADFVPGLVHYDGQFVEIDLTTVEGREEAVLLFQLLNSDDSSGSVVTVRPLSNIADLQAVGVTGLPSRDTIVAAGDLLDLSSMAPSNEARVLLQNVRFDSFNNLYTAELSVRNEGLALGRQIAVLFPDLPSEVTFVNPSGYYDGNPYVNMSNAIPAGGLGANTSSQAVEIRLENPVVECFKRRINFTRCGIRFPLKPILFVGEPNRPPVLEAIASLSVMPGNTVQAQLFATDPDGDPVAFSIRADSSNPTLPRGTLRANGTLTFSPAPSDIGTYHFTLIASDGVSKATQPVTLDVIADATTTTRISGTVLDTNGPALADIPIELGDLQTVTATDGSFQLELPTNLPREDFDITIPTGEPLFDPFGTGDQTISFARSAFNPSTGTSTDNPRQQINAITAFLDGSQIYGSNAERALALRTNDGSGQLKTSPGDLLPFNNATYFPDGPLTNANAGLSNPSTLFAAGDIRSNDNVALASLHTLFVREHNRLAKEIAAAAPGLSGDEIYERARRLVIAELQHITYDEFLPTLLGPNPLGAYTVYNPTLNPGTSNFFATVSFRFGHSAFNSEIFRLDGAGNEIAAGHLSLRDATFTSEPIVAEGIEPILRGLAAQQAQAVDTKIIPELRNMLFGPPGSGGIDLVAVDIQRARDHGMPTYNQARVDFGLAPALSFAEVTSDTALQTALQSVYGTVDEIEAFVGGLAEDPLPGAMVGPLFAVSFVDQFTRVRDVDRFWYENEQLTEDELDDIRSTTLHDIILRNTSITSLSDHVFTGGTQPSGPGAGGAPGTSPPSTYRSLDGAGNHPTNTEWGSAGADFLRLTTANYSDGVSDPAIGPNPRAISNAVFDQAVSIPNSLGVTDFFTLWSQFVAHDLDFSSAATPDTLKVHGEDFAKSETDPTYPFIAETLHLLLGHEPFQAVNNVIQRPIYLPQLDVDNGTRINPGDGKDDLVSQELTPGHMASLLIKDGSLRDQAGNLFDKVLHITEVPLDRTPAALPDGLKPDVVVTIQPGEMVFTEPAQLTLPNTAAFPPGVDLQLWSINPTSGEFEIVGTGRALDDGSAIETVEGGIRNSSWHFFTILLGDLEPISAHPANPSTDTSCTCPGNSLPDITQHAAVEAQSEVELHSGALRESHDLATYQSLGRTRGVTLSYDSSRVNNRSTAIHFRHPNIDRIEIPPPGDGITVVEQRVWARVELNVGDLKHTFPDHFWALPQPVTRFEAALEADLSNVPTGAYDVTIRSAVENVLSNGQIIGDQQSSSMTTLVVDGSHSPFGPGWGLVGFQELTVQDDSVVLVDGDGSELLFEAPTVSGMPFQSPAGDHSIFEQLPDGRYRRTLLDQTVYHFNSQHKLASITDRNGNTTQFEYDDSGRLKTIVDPADLPTTFTYEGDKVTQITDPANRSTRLEYDDFGNLERIIDPDETFRTFSYDSQHLMTGEINKRTHTEQVFYDSFGRVREVMRADKSRMFFAPAQAYALLPQSVFLDNQRPRGLLPRDAIATVVDSNGNVTEYKLDREGQINSVSDEVGLRTEVFRDEHHRVTRTIDGRGNVTTFEYDDRGNVTRVSDTVSVESSLVGLPFQGALGVGRRPSDLVLADFNDDEFLDVVTANSGNNTISVVISDEFGGLRTRNDVDIAGQPINVFAAYVDDDLVQDIVVAHANTDGFSVLLGEGFGDFSDPINIETEGGVGTATIGDLDDDGNLDLAFTTPGTGSASRRIAVLFGDGKGNFGDQINLGLNVSSLPSQLSLADLDTNGSLDIITAGPLAKVFVYFGQGARKFMSAKEFSACAAPNCGIPRMVDIADLDADGHLDIVTANEDSGGNRSISVLKGPDLSLPVNTYLSNSPVSAQIGDVNQDEIPDLIVANQNDTVSVFLGGGTDGFLPPWKTTVTGTPSSLRLHDVDDNGTIDIVVAASSADRVSILLGDGKGKFAAQADTPNQVPLLFEAHRNIAGADFDQDGIPDIVVPNNDSISVLFGSTDGSFQRVEYAIDQIPVSVARADIDGDGHIDIAVGTIIRSGEGVGEGNVIMLFGQANRELSEWERQDIRVARNPIVVEFADVSGDGALDLVTANHNRQSASISLRLGNGTREFSGNDFDFGNSLSMALGDFDSDGDAEIVVSQPQPPSGGGSNEVVVLNATAAGDLSVTNRIQLFNGAHSVAVADLNDDGRLEILAAQANGELVILEEGANGFEVSFSVAAGLPGFIGNDLKPSTISVGSINGDAHLDIAVAGGDGVAVFLGDGTGRLPHRLDGATGQEQIATALVDLDKDGDLDIVALSAQTFATRALTVIANDTQERAHLSRGRGYRSFTYEGTFNQLTSITDDLGKITLFEIDATNGNTRSITRVVGTLDAEGSENDDLITRFEYTENGLLDLQTDPLLRVTDFDYDTHGRLKKLTFAIGTADEAFQEFDYDDAGNQTVFIDEERNTYQFGYDIRNNRLMRITEPDPDGTVGIQAAPITRFDYDANGNLKTVKNAEDTVTEYEYDKLDRLITTTVGEPDLKHITRYGYDKIGNLRSITDPLLHVTRYRYDTRHRRIRLTDPDGGVTRFGYDTDNNLTLLIDPINNASQFVYDARNRLVQETDPLGKKTAYKYDPSNNLIRKTDRNGRITAFVYDDLDWLMTETWIDADQQTTVNTITYEYDRASNLKSVNDVSSALFFEYDKRGRVTEVNNAGTPHAPNVLVGYSFDDVGNVLTVHDTIDGQPGGVTAYLYDALNRVTQITQDGQNVTEKRVALSYNLLGQFDIINRFSDLEGAQLIATTDYDYDNLNRLDVLKHVRADSSPIALYNFSYDTASRISSIEDVDGLTKYMYDKRDQLRSADREDTDIRGNETYGYDPNGNRTTSHLHERYTTGIGNRLESDGEFTYDYDDEGNLTVRTEKATGLTRTFQYDHSNQLIRVVDRDTAGAETQRVEYSYDALGRRISKSVDTNPQDTIDAVITHFVYDREDVILDFVDPDGTGPEPNGLAVRYLHGPGIDQVLAQEMQNESLWQLTDHLGTVHDLVDGEERAAHHFVYDSFGNLLRRGDSALPTRYLFSGREFDKEVDLLYFRARIYDPTIGRFISEDPVGTVLAQNAPYAYVNNAPAMFVDLFGQEPQSARDIFDQMDQEARRAEEAERVERQRQERIERIVNQDVQDKLERDQAIERIKRICRNVFAGLFKRDPKPILKETAKELARRAAQKARELDARRRADEHERELRQDPFGPRRDPFGNQMP